MPDSFQIRPMIAEDIQTLVCIAEATGVFKELELEVLEGLLDDYLDTLAADDERHRCRTLLVEGEIAGFVYFAPTPMTEATWHLYWIVVDATRHGQGLGKLLLFHAEQAIKDCGGELLVIETSMLPTYQATRDFYLRNGYTKVGEIANYYSRGDAMGIYSKGLETT